MFRDHPALGDAPRRRMLLCLLLLGLLLHGHAGVLRQLLGAAHWHVVPAALAPDHGAGDHGLTRLLAWRQALQARSPLAGGHLAGGEHHVQEHHRGQHHDHPHGHHHDGTQRHHHDHDDPTVVRLEHSADSDDPLADLAAGSLLQPLALAQALRWADTTPARVPWPPAAAAAWRSASLRLPERPPPA